MQWGTAVGLLLAAALLAGCTDRPEEGGTAPPVASSSPTPAVSPSTPPAGTDVAQITALSKDYFAETNKALNSGDTKRLRSLFTAGCSSCEKSAAYVERHWASGSIKAPGYWQVRQVSGVVVTSPGNGHSNVVFTTGQETLLNAAGHTSKINPADPKPAAAGMSFVKVQGLWKVARIVIQV